jgi:ribosomal protein S13
LLLALFIFINANFTIETYFYRAFYITKQILKPSNMAYKLVEIKGIGEAHAATLKDKLGISTVEELLQLGASKKGREEIAAKTGIGEGHILRWVNMADMFRIKGVAEDFSDLLEMAGVDTVKELRTRNAANLHAKLAEANAQRQVSGRLPRMDEVESWIAIASQLEPKVTH